MAEGGPSEEGDKVREDNVGDDTDDTEDIPELKQGATFRTWAQLWKSACRYSLRKNIVFSKEHMKKVDKANEKVEPGHMRFPEYFVYVSGHLACKHHGKTRPTGNGQRPTQSSLKTGCPCVAVIGSSRRNDWLHIISFNEEHNHPVNRQRYELYPENRRLDGDYLNQAKTLLGCNVSAAQVAQYITEMSGKKIMCQDIKNIRIVKDSHDYAFVEGFDQILAMESGNEGCMWENEEKAVDMIYFQSATMKRNMAKFPELLVMDTTHNVNNKELKLTSLMVIDNCNRGQVVAHALMKHETKEMMVRFLKHFVENNGEEMKRTKLMIVDRSTSETKAIEAVLPNVPVHLCLFHVKNAMFKYLATFKLNKRYKAELEDLLDEIVDAYSREDFDEAVETLYQQRGIDEFLGYFDRSWLKCEHVWARYSRKGLPTMDTRTTNHLESFHRQVKEYIAPNATIYNCVLLMYKYTHDKEIRENREEIIRGMKYTYNQTDKSATASRLYALYTKQAAKKMLGQKATLKDKDRKYRLTDLPDGQILVTENDKEFLVTMNEDELRCSCTFQQDELMLCRHGFYIMLQKDWRLNSSWVAARWRNDYDVLHSSFAEGKVPAAPKVVPTNPPGRFNESMRHLTKMANMFSSASNEEYRFHYGNLVRYWRAWLAGKQVTVVVGREATDQSGASTRENTPAPDGEDEANQRGTVPGDAGQEDRGEEPDPRDQNKEGDDEDEDPTPPKRRAGHKKVKVLVSDDEEFEDEGVNAGGTQNRPDPLNGEPNIDNATHEEGERTQEDSDPKPETNNSEEEELQEESSNRIDDEGHTTEGENDMDGHVPAGEASFEDVPEEDNGNFDLNLESEGEGSGDGDKTDQERKEDANGNDQDIGVGMGESTDKEVQSDEGGLATDEEKREQKSESLDDTLPASQFKRDDNARSSESDYEVTFKKQVPPKSPRVVIKDHLGNRVYREGGVEFERTLFERPPLRKDQRRAAKVGTKKQQKDDKKAKKTGGKGKGKAKRGRGRPRKSEGANTEKNSDKGLPEGKEKEKEKTAEVKGNKRGRKKAPKGSLAERRRRRKELLSLPDSDSDEEQPRLRVVRPKRKVPEEWPTPEKKKRTRHDKEGRATEGEDEEPRRAPRRATEGGGYRDTAVYAFIKRHGPAQMTNLLRAAEQVAIPERTARDRRTLRENTLLSLEMELTSPPNDHTETIRIAQTSLLDEMREHLSDYEPERRKELGQIMALITTFAFTKQMHIVEAIPTLSALPHLPETEKKALQKPKLRLRDRRKFYIGNNTVYVNDLNNLNNGEWLCDNVINIYLGYLAQEENLRNPRTVFMLPSQTAQMWAKNNYRSIFSKIPLMDYKWVMLPVNPGHHWLLLAANMENLELTVLDSLHNERRATAWTENWMTFITARNAEMGEEQGAWTVSNTRSSRQDDGDSCGLFTLMNATALLQGLRPAAMRMTHTKNYRLHVAMTIKDKMHSHDKPLCEMPDCTWEAGKEGGPPEMQNCDNCGKWGHLPCVGLEEKPHHMVRWCCPYCVD